MLLGIGAQGLDGERDGQRELAEDLHFLRTGHAVLRDGDDDRRPVRLAPRDRQTDISPKGASGISAATPPAECGRSRWYRQVRASVR